MKASIDWFDLPLVIYSGSVVAAITCCKSVRTSAKWKFMTTPEHTLVGIHVAFVFGVHRFLGWTAVAMAGLASNVPDWDGLPMLFDMQRFEAGHRVWGHNVLAIILSSLILGWTQIRYSWIEKIGVLLAKRVSVLENDAPTSETRQYRSILTFTAIAMLAQALHLPCDMVVSGGKGLSDWPVQPFWPFSHAGFVYPMIPWGDVGPTVILMTGIIITAKRPAYISIVSFVTLIAICAYLVTRAWVGAVLFA